MSWEGAAWQIAAGRDAEIAWGLRPACLVSGQGEGQDVITNRPFDSLRLGDSAEVTRAVTEEALLVFASATGNHNPMHLPDRDVDGDGKPEALASGIFVASMISALLGNQLPGPGTLYKAQTLTFHRAARAGDELRARVTVTGLEPGGTVRLAAEVARLGDEALILSGEAVVAAPKVATRPRWCWPGTGISRRS